MLFGAAFPWGYAVVVGGAELFRQQLDRDGCLDGQVSWGAMLRNWCIVYGSNFWRNADRVVGAGNRALKTARVHWD